MARLVRQIGFQALPGLVVAWAAIGRSGNAAWVVPAIVAALVLLAAFGLLSYLRFRYRVGNERVQVRKGVLHREELDIDFDRIQNVNIREPFYMRPFGLAVLGIDTAGSSGKEIELAGIERQRALAIRQRLLGAIATQDADTGLDGQPGQANDDEVLLSLGRRDVLVYGLTTNMMLWLALAVGAVFGTGNVPENYFEYLTVSPQLQTAIDFLRREGGALLLGLAVAGLMVLMLLLLPVVSMIGALLRHDGYRLSRHGDTFRKSSGLLTRHDESVRQHKIQAVVWKQNFIARWLGRVNLQLRQASAGSELESGNLPSGSRAQFMVPALRPAQAGQLSGVFLPGCDPGAFLMSDIKQAHYVRKYLAIILAIAAIPATVLAALLHASFLGLLAVVGGVAFVILRRRARKFGWAADAGHGVMREGFIGETTTMFPLFKVQRVDLHQSLLQRRKGIATLTLHLASHSLTLPSLDVSDARRLRDLALYAAESGGQKWF